jgi:hypothetical protein
VVISESTKNWLESEQELAEKLDFIPHKKVTLESVEKIIDSYIVK